MLKKTSNLWQEFRRNKYVYISQLLLAAIITLDYAIGINIDHALGNWFYLLPTASLFILSVPLFADWNLYRAKSFILLIYSIVIGAYLVSFTSIFGPYFPVLILLLFAYTYWYRIRGLAYGTIVSLLVMIIASWYQFDNINGDLYLELTIRSVLLVVVGVLFLVASRDDIEDVQEKTLKESVSFERDRLLSLVNSMADAVVATDSHGHIVLFNGAALALANTNVSISGKSLAEILPLHDTKNQPINIIEYAHKKNRVIKREDLHFINNENREVDVYISVSPIRSGFTERGDQGFIIVLRDITKQKTLDEERDEFISVTSHELRTPIAIAEANISTALMPKIAKNLDGKVRELLEQAHHNILFLGDLVNDMTVLARAERGDLKMEVSEVHAKELLEKLSHDYQKEAEDKGLHISVDVPDQLPAILTNELYVHEIIQNFITNALKYTEKGSITLRAESAGNNVRFSVKDTGIGIGASDKLQIFSKFYRAEDFRTRKTRGTGLGLYITLKLVQRIKGKVWFSSELNKGSVFYLEVPPIGAQKQDQPKVANAEVKKFIKSV